MALLQRLGAFGLAFQQGHELRQRGFERIQRLEERLADAGIRLDLAHRQAGIVPGEGQAQVPRGALKGCRDPHPVGGVPRMREAFGHGVPRELQQLAGRQALAEKQRGRIGELVRFVEDHRIGSRQQLGHAGVAQHHVGKEQVVVDHHDVRLLCFLAGAHHKALFVARALGAEAVVAGRGDQLPDRRVFRHRGQLALVA